MEVSPSEQLETLKYSELQRLAKTLGLKANVKADRLLNLLKQHISEPKWETRSMDTKRTSLSTDYEECDSNQKPVDLVMVTKKHQKLNCHNEQEHPDTESIGGENAEVFLKEEIVTQLNENERSQDAESRKSKDKNQNECRASDRMPGNLAENLTTLRNQKEKNCTMHKRLESKTAVNYFPGTELCYPRNLSRSTRRINSGTPNFRKLHEAQFKKMQSIDDYMEKKNKRIHNFSNSVNKAKMCSSGFLLSPHPQKPIHSATCTPINLRRTPQNSHIVDKNTLSQKSSFISTGFSANKMTVRFSESTKDNEHKRSLTKTPSRKSPFLNSCTPGSQKKNKAVTRKKCTGAAAKCPVTETPASTGVTSSNAIPEIRPPLSTKKPVFDLQASLSRPLNYQPHRGKLKPWGKSKENHQSVCSHRKNYKQPVLQSREERREKHAQGRKQRKDKVLETRRGLAII